MLSISTSTSVAICCYHTVLLLDGGPALFSEGWSTVLKGALLLLISMQTQ